MRFKELSVLLLLLLLPVSASAVTLQEAFEGAIRVRASISNAKIDREIAEEDRSLAYSNVLPSLFASSESRWLDSVSLSGDTERFSQSFQHTGRLGFEQPIFQGGGEFFGLKIANASRDVARLEEAQERLNVFFEVSSLYYQLLSLRQEQETLEEQQETLKEQVGYLEERAEIGRSRVSEVLSAQSRMARVDAQLAASKSQDSLLEKEFLWLTGVPGASNLEDPIEDLSLNLPANSIDLVFSRPEIKAEEIRLQNKRREIRVAQGGFLPTVDFSGNYYLDRDGILSGSDWDLTLFARWEFFSGFETKASARIAKLEARKIEIALSDLKERRRAEFEGLVTQLELQKSSLEKLENAERLAKKNVKEQMREFEMGLVNNLEVLEALENHILVKSTLDNERFSAHQTWLRIQLLMGKTL